MSPRTRTARVVTGALLLALWLNTGPAAPANSKASPPCCVIPAPAQPAAADERGTPKQPLAVEVMNPPPPTLIRLPEDPTGRVVAGATIFLGLITAALAFFTFRLWRSTSDLVTENMETAERELRAYVFVETAFVRNTVKEPIRAYVALKNSGKTPAYNVRLMTRAEVSANMEGLPPLPQEDGESFGHLGPGAPLLVSVPPDAVLSDAQRQSVLQDHAALYARGRVRYWDAFERPHLLEFCVFSRGEAAFENTRPMASCSRGNRTDDNIGTAAEPA
jgi:hypothetical protein